MDVHRAIRTRRSVRAYLSKPIPEDVMLRMKESLRFAPSACNFQPWHFIFVTDEAVRKDLAEAARGQKWMAHAPVIVVACAMPDQAYKKMGGYGNSADVDVTIAVDHLTLAAVSEGLGTCWIGAFDEKKVKQLLGVPESVKVVVMTPVGYPERPSLNRPVDEAERKDESEIFSTNRFGAR